MTLRPQLRFVYGQTAWMLGVLVVLTLLSALTYDLFFMLSLIGLLVLLELTDPIEVTPEWRSRLKWVLLAGLLVFGFLAFNRVYEIFIEKVA